MDEPNSNLDAEGEAALDMAIRASLQRGAAVIVVAHRPSALHAVSHILVLSEGKSIAYGPKDEVMKQVTQPRAGQPIIQQKQQPATGTSAQIQIPATRN